MCGIVGIFDSREIREIDRELLSKMNEVQHHRGPDQSGIHIEPGIGLAHKRLSIIDLSSGEQPLFNEDGTVVVVYNGEMYNYKELTQELQSDGHVFKTHSDTEVIVHAWEQWGSACVERFRGMFAFALWDRKQQTLFLARDRLGIKPLYYAALADGHIVFSSELKAIMLDPRLSQEVDPYAVEDYFGFGYVPEPKTIYKQAKKLPPGYTLTVKRGTESTLRPVQYWDVPFTPVSGTDQNAVQDELIARLKEAIKIHMVAEVPLGAFLSGGVDSSAVVALMSGFTEKKVSTCSISFGDREFNEAQYADLVANLYNTNHHVEQVNPDDFDLIDKLARLYDEPYADSSAIPTYRVCELARKSVTVALSGDGGDENFAGYGRYARHLSEERLRNFLPPLIRHTVFGLLGRAYPDLPQAPRMFRAKATFEMMAQNTIEGYFDRISVVRNSLRAQLFSRQFQAELQGYNATEVLARHAKNAPTRHPLSLIQYLDMKTYLPGDILTKVDRASMAHALEVRVPVLDHEFVEWVSGLPPEWKFGNGVGKHIFKKSLEPYLPSEILYRPKMGFAVPLAKWFRGPLRSKVQDAVKGPLSESGFFDQKILSKVLSEHLSGRRDFSAVLWSLLMFNSALNACRR